MYQNNRTNYFGRRFNGGGGNNNRNRFQKRRSSGPTIDVAKFVNKTPEVITEEKYIATNSFKDFPLEELLQQNIEKKGFLAPMPIQDQAITHILEGKDLIGIANTGTGKTLAFLIPMLNKVLKNRSEKVLIIAPTRELAIQIDNELYGLTFRLNINRVVCIGGTSMGNQFRALRGQFNFVIGTPGRLLDLSKRGALRFASFNNVVLDEVDRMFDMGFSKDIKLILSEVSRNRQSLFFSATVDMKVENLIKEHSNNPIRVSVKTRDTASSVDQDVVKVLDKSKKMDMLHDLLTKEDFEKVLIFGKTKVGVNRLMMDLKQRGFKADSIHGNKTQSQRQNSLRSFKEGRINILVATDVAARGLDIPNVTHVINYEIPETYEDYIHRIGRTGRANTTGKALTFI